MSNNVVDDIITKLKRLKSSALFQLAPNCGEPFLISREALRRCAFFDVLLSENPNSTEYATNISPETLAAFIAFLEDGKSMMIAELDNAFEAIVVGRQFRSTEFVQHCCNYATDVQCPPNAKSDDVCFVLQALVRHLPLRAFEHYDALLNAMTGHMSAAEKDTAIDGMIEALAQKKDEANALPVPVLEKKFTVALMKNMQGESTVTILLNRAWVPFNIFGPHFCPFVEEVKRFHLAYARYVVYEKLDGRVMFSHLKPDEPSQLLYPNCKFFRSRCNQLHMIRNDDTKQIDCLYEWSDNAMCFEEKFSRPTSSLRTAHRKSDGSLAVVFESGTAVEVLNSIAQPGGTNLSDYIESCKLWMGQPGDWAELSSQLIHVGYNHVCATSRGNDLYETRFYENFWPKGSSHIHGPVKTFSDVLLVLPTPWPVHT